MTTGTRDARAGHGRARDARTWVRATAGGDVVELCPIELLACWEALRRSRPPVLFPPAPPGAEAA